MRVTPAAGEGISFEHFEQQAGAAACRMHFFASHHVTGAHGAMIFFAAFSDSDASSHGYGKAVAIVGIVEMCERIRRFVFRSKPEVIDDAIGLNDFARIPLP